MCEKEGNYRALISEGGLLFVAQGKKWSRGNTVQCV